MSLQYSTTTAALFETEVIKNEKILLLDEIIST